MEQARGTNTGIPYHAVRIRTNPTRESPTCSFLLRRDRVNVPTRPAEKPPAKARERRVSGASRNVEVGGERSELEGGSEGKGRPSADGRNSSAVRFAVGADCCGAIGCHETDGLLVVEQGGETRTLCPDHARRWSG